MNNEKDQAGRNPNANSNDIPDDYIPQVKRPARPQSVADGHAQNVPVTHAAPQNVQNVQNVQNRVPQGAPQARRRVDPSKLTPEQRAEYARRMAARRALEDGRGMGTHPAPHTAKQSRAPQNRNINRASDAERENARTEEGSTGGGAVASLIKAILYIVVVVAVAGLLSYYIIVFGNDMYAFVKSDEEVEVTIPEYATVDEIADILGDAGVIKYPRLLVLYAKLKKIDKNYEFIAGDYTVNGMMNYDELFYAFVPHKSYETVRLTIPEGYTVDEMIKLFTENGIGTRDKFIDVINNYDFDFEFVKALDASDLTGRTYRLEGYLYPDTYEFYKGSSEETVIYKMLNRFDVIFSDSFYEVANNLGYSVDQIITLASMIEKEARYSADYEQVSSVFHNRLNDPANYPYLESDATIMYAIQVRDGERKTSLTGEDLAYDTPYNTYLYKGLPPGPIANPGYEAITCALYPAKTKYYFFVSDNFGNTYFSRTNAEHNAAKAKVAKINAEG